MARPPIGERVAVIEQWKRDHEDLLADMREIVDWVKTEKAKRTGGGNGRKFLGLSTDRLVLGALVVGAMIGTEGVHRLLSTFLGK